MKFPLERIGGVEVIYDDLPLCGKDEESHDKALTNVIESPKKRC